MDAVTHPEVAEVVSSHFVPLHLSTEKEQERARALEVRWLPGQVILQDSGRVEHRWVGFLKPASYKVELDFGRAMFAMSTKDYEGADRLFSDLVLRRPGAARAAEACYWWGVSEYRRTKDFVNAVRKWSLLVEKFPNDPWVEKIDWIVQEAGAVQGAR